jgi:hypothetical protein
MTSIHNPTESINVTLPDRNVSGNANENLNSISKTRTADDRRITKRRVIRAMYASFF